MKIEQYIHSYNEANRVARNEVNNVLTQLTKHIGKKIFLTNGQYAKSFIIDFLRESPESNKKMNILHATNHGVRLEEKYGKLCLIIKMDFGIKEKPANDYCIANYWTKDITIGTCEPYAMLEKVWDIESILKHNGLDQPDLNEQEEKEKLNTYSIMLKHLQDIRATIKVGSEFIPKYV